MIHAIEPNTLPLPAGALLAKDKKSLPANVQQQEMAPIKETPVLPPVVVDMNDNFPKGKISKFYQHQGYGFIQSAKGKEIYFSLSEVDFAGVKGKEAIIVGTPIGYDVSHTSHGLHVKKMKIY